MPDTSGTFSITETLGESVSRDDAILFVTGAWFGLTEARREKEAQLGSPLVFKPDVRGLPENSYAG